jgi:ribonuclease HII
VASVFGIDEAGKGPVLGSMFAAAVRVPDPEVLPAGIDDSKRLAPERRRSIAAALRDHEAVAIGVAEIPVARIDGEADMNTLTVAAHAAAAAEVGGGRRGGGAPAAWGGGAGAPPPAARGVWGGAGGDAVADDETGAVTDAAPDATGDVPTGLADAGDTSESRFARRVADRVPAEVNLTAEHGADEDHAVVGAASIVAKVARDAHVAALADEYAERHGEAFGDLGSGYPSDPKTREFLETFVAEYGRLPDCARRSWSTCEDVLAAHQQSGLAEF